MRTVKFCLRPWLVVANCARHQSAKPKLGLLTFDFGNSSRVERKTRIRNIAKSEENRDSSKLETFIRNSKTYISEISNDHAGMGNFANFNINVQMRDGQKGRDFPGIFASHVKRYEYRTVYFETRNGSVRIRNIDHFEFRTIFISKFEM